MYARTVNGVCMTGLAVVEALWRRTGITGIIKHAMEASYEEISCTPNHQHKLCMADLGL